MKAIGKELTFKAKNISGKPLMPGEIVIKVKENKFYSFLTKIGLRTVRVKLAEAKSFDATQDLYFIKEGEIAEKAWDVTGIDTSKFNAGDDLYLSNDNSGAFVTGLKPEDFNPVGVVMGKEIEPGIYQVKLS